MKTYFISSFVGHGFGDTVVWRWESNELQWKWEVRAFFSHKCGYKNASDNYTITKKDNYIFDVIICKRHEYFSFKNIHKSHEYFTKRIFKSKGTKKEFVMQLINVLR